jgi:PAS domain S-box-containing protein
MKSADDKPLFVGQGRPDHTSDQSPTTPVLIRLYRWFLPDKTGEELRRAQIVANISLFVFSGAVAILIFAGIIAILNPGWLILQSSDILFNSSGLVVSGVALLLNREGRTLAAAWSVTLLLLGNISGILYVGGSPSANPVGILALLLLVTISVTVFDRPGIMIVFTLSSTLFIALNTLWILGHLPEIVVRDDPSRVAFVILGWTLICGTMMIVTISAQSSLQKWTETLERRVRQRTAELQHVKERVEAILNNSPDGILLVSRDGQIEIANLVCGALLHRPVADLTGTAVFGLLAASQGEAFIKEFEAVVEQRAPARIETVVQRSNGSTFDADIAMAPIHEKDRVTGVVCSIRDISDLKEVERMKDMFLSIAAHELRTPLTSVRGFSEILLTRDISPERYKRFMLFISQQTRQLAKIIDDLLDISRMRSGYGIELNIKPVDMAEVIGRAVLPFLDNLSGHRIRVETPDPLPTINGDPMRLEQVILNLVSNAIKYSPSGSEVIIRSRVVDDGLEVSVQDQGIGISGEDQARVYDRFYRGEIARMTTGGTGLGLTICKLIVEGHGGRIQIDSAPGEGTTVSFVVPIEGRNQHESQDR